MLQYNPPGTADGDASGAAALLRCMGTEFRQILDRLPVAAYACDGDGRIVYFNRSAVDIWGRAPSLDDPGERYCGASRLFNLDGRPITLDRSWMALALHTETAYLGREIVIEQPDGRRRAVLVYANPIRDDADRLLGALNVMLDITERHQSEFDQRRLQSAVAHAGRLRLAGEMAAALAHDINQPLTAIVNYAEACLNVLAAGGAHGDQMLSGQLREIARQGERAAGMVRQLREFTRRPAGVPCVVALDDPLREAVDMLAAEVRAHEAKIIFDASDGLPPVRVDPLQIQQVLVSLVHNALEAMDALEPERREIRVFVGQTQPGWLTVTVSDTGPGVPESVERRLFEPFVTSKATGVGISLSLCRSIIEAHGGQLWLASNGPGGASFCFRLPVAD